MSWAPITRSWKGLGGGATTWKQKTHQEALTAFSSPSGYRPGLRRLQDYLPWLRRHHFPGDFHGPHLHLPVQLERGIHSRPAGWMAPTSCPANGCLPRLLSDSTISQWHPGTHGTSRKNDVLQKQMHAARADGNSRSHVHNEALDISHGL